MAARQGLLARTTTTARARQWLGEGELSSAPVALVVFTPIGPGKAVFRAVEGRAESGSKRVYVKMCAGRGRLDRLVRWIAPVDLNGRKVTQVTYTFNAVDVPDIIPAEGRARLTRPQEGTATLVEASDGWSVADR